ncbi:hypothetical protein ACGFIG_09470 [Micromonospora sp. NPDC049048]|uniref:hypothetical protein n=1 Tax=Micromonospora sp. NPDC049048 TaxID=3364263 RepID=UPI00371A504E
MTALLITLAVLVVLLLIALATASLLAYGYADALAATTAERDEAIAEARTARREERGLRADLARLTAQHAIARAALTPDAPAERPWPRWGHRTLRDIHLAASPADFDTPGETP